MTLSISAQGFNSQATLARIRQEKAIQRKRSYYPHSRLDRFNGEILALRAEGASASEVQLWLRKECRTKVALSTVTRWLAKYEN